MRYFSKEATDNSRTVDDGLSFDAGLDVSIRNGGPLSRSTIALHIT